MNTMAARAVAGFVILILIGPAVVAATCELTCAMATHHQTTPASSEASCHEHQGSTQGVSVSANPVGLCHESGDLPSAVVDAWLSTSAIATIPVAATVPVPPLAARSIVRAPDRSVLFDPRPAHRPIRI